MSFDGNAEMVNEDDLNNSVRDELKSKQKKISF